MTKLNALQKDTVWGRELWIASTHPAGLQPELRELAGGDFPLLVKIIEARQRLSVQVHPDDALAQLYEHSRGKTECWLVLAAQPGAQVVYGLNGVYTDQELRDALEANSLEDCLRYVPVEQGDFVYIPAGTVHALLGGITVLEVQQSSDVTYRLYDWGRDRELHVAKGIASIKSGGTRPVSLFPGAFSCQYFELEEISVEGAYDLSVAKSSPSVVLAYVLSGSGAADGTAIAQGDMLAFAPGESVRVTGSGLSLMRITAASA